MAEFRIPLRKPLERPELSRCLGALLLCGEAELEAFRADPAAFCGARGWKLTPWEIREMTELLADPAWVAASQATQAIYDSLTNGKEGSDGEEDDEEADEDDDEDDGE